MFLRACILNYAKRSFHGYFFLPLFLPDAQMFVRPTSINTVRAVVTTSRPELQLFIASEQKSL